ncbi:MAG: aspartate-alanine antiporter, partial [Rikenellaceae bacterium]|nr:aspartate-alanine antiporter [Rikenellaceae bacterium]
MELLAEFLRKYPEVAVFLTLGIGFWLGKLHYKSFSLGTVTSVLLVGVLIGQLNIPISGPLKSLFFLLFLFAIGYSVGPQFFHSLRSSGLKQVAFAVIQCMLCLVVTFIVAKLFGYNVGQAVGLLSGAQTISAVIGVGSDTINNLNISPQQKQEWINIIPVCYAVTYIYGTIGSAYILGTLGVRLLGGEKKLREATRQYEAKLNKSSVEDDPAYINANRPGVFRAYKIENSWFSKTQSVERLENHLQELGRRVFVERIRKNGKIVDNPTPDFGLGIGDEIVLSGRREEVIGDESWIGQEISDSELLNFPAKDIFVMLTHKNRRYKRVELLRRERFMHGVMIKSITRSGVELPVLNGTELLPGDMLELVGLEREVNFAAPRIGHVDMPTIKTDMIFVGLGIVAGCIMGALTVHWGGVPISLSTSGGALIAGLVLGWLRTKNPSFGRIPQSSLWIMNNLGLNLFIAVVGITAGPTFIKGISQVG